MSRKSPSPGDYKGPRGPLRHRCASCGSTHGQLLKCCGCGLVRYCNREHQAQHRQKHKADCNKMKKARVKLAMEDDAIRNAAQGFMVPSNVFETHVGHFWGLYHTRDYMRARYAVAHDARMAGTLDGVKESLHHFLDMLRLCRSDNMGVRDQIPALMLRLDMDQECYDFVKWWATCDPDGRYDWGDMSLPYMNIHGADAFEKPTWLLKEYSHLNWIVAVLLLNLKVTVDVRNIKVARKVVTETKRLPPELADPIELAVIRSPLSIELQKLSYHDLLKFERRLLGRIRTLGAAIVGANKNYMFQLFKPDEYLCYMPEHYSHGSVEEACFALQFTYAAWWETTGVLELLEEAVEIAKAASKRELPRLMEVDARAARQPRTPEQMLADVGINRVWWSLEWAMRDLAYLGPWSERPSVQDARHVAALEQRFVACREQH